VHRILLAAAVAAFLASAVEAAAPPNVVFILADDLGWGDLGCYGQTKIKTPNVDRLAADGMRFTQHYAGCTVCAPSRCSLMTGKHTGHAAIRGNKPTPPEGQWPIPADSFTVGKLFQQAGYRTACIGKWGLGMPDNSGDPNRQGFDHYFGYLCQAKAHSYYPPYLWRNGKKVDLPANQGGAKGTYSHDLLTAEALDFVRENKSRPFFLYLAYTIPHLALQVPEDSLAEYRGKWPDPPYDGKKGYQPQPTPRSAYAAMITRMDRDVGRLMALIKDSGLDDSTLVIFASDNGPTFVVGGADSAFFKSAGPFRGLKESPYEGGIRIPFIARWPGHIKPGTTSDLPSAFWDFLPTCSDLLGRSPPPDTDGLSYLPTLLGRPGEQTKHDYLYWEWVERGPKRQWQCLREGDWKAIRFVAGDRLELYNLGRDPGETTDVAGQFPDVARRLRVRMTEVRTESAEFPMARAARNR
jgi:arylsulfatase